MAINTGDLCDYLADRRSKPDASVADAAWLVLDAASDLGDEAAVAACRRVIDAALNGRPAAQPDLHVVQNYFG